MAELNDFMAEWLSDKPYVSAKTSGSTGQPKPIELLKSDMMLSALATNRFFGIEEHSVLATPLSLSYIAGKMMAVRAHVAGCEFLHMPVSNDIRIERHIDLLSIVPTQAYSLLQQPHASELVDNLLLGGAPVSDELAIKICNAGFNAWIGYGMTETCSHVAIRKLNETVFNAMPGINFEHDSRGCLTVCSEKFSWGKLQTNDVVDLISPTSFVWLGRYDNVVNSGGLKLHPELIEQEIRRIMPEIAPFYLVGEPDEKLGQHLVMVMEGESHGILDKIKELLSDRKAAPKRIVSVDKLPLTPGGNKVRRIIPD